MTDPLPQRLVNTRQAARYLGISPRSLWSLYNRGELPTVRLGRSVRFDVDDLDIWIRHTKTQASKTSRRKKNG